MCSGGLIADSDPGTQIPYFLTANHCISKDRDAANLECYFQYATSGCHATCPGPGAFPRTIGASIMDSSRDGDHTLLQLSQDPPSGSVFLGWTTTPVANSDGTQLFRISHPSGMPQAYSKHAVETTLVECSGLAIGEFIYSEDLDGATEGGSSGSPVMNMNGQIVGQLYGACGYTLEVCDPDQNRTVDGAFAFYYSQVAPFLGPTGNNPPTASFTYTTNGLTATFTDTSTDSDGTIVGWDWDFGDGDTSTQQNPSHTYAADGTYTVTLTVTDDDGATDTTSQPVTVSSGGPGGTEMHVASIVVTLKAAGPNNTCKAVVTILDENNNPVGGATVTGTFSGDAYGTDSGVTDASGEATLSVLIKGKGAVSTFTFCVDDVTLTDYTYVPGDNVVTCATY
jgi:PKD repeat protein